MIKVNLHCDTSEKDAGVDDTPCAPTLAAAGLVQLFRSFKRRLTNVAQSPIVY